MHRIFLHSIVLLVGLFAATASFADSSTAHDGVPHSAGNAAAAAAVAKGGYIADYDDISIVKGGPEVGPTIIPQWGSDTAREIKPLEWNWVDKLFYIPMGWINSFTDQLGPEVEQPIDFPHDRHAGDPSKVNPDGKTGDGINCMYCHTFARRSLTSGIPPLRKCIGCHQNIPSVRDTPRIVKLFEYWDAGKPIPWKKVHDLPDYVRFNHERHIQRFVFKQERPYKEVCGYCHGDIASMGVARRVRTLSMGFCVNCHKKNHALDSTFTKAGHGPNDCFMCHK